jgi:TolB-like protein
MWGEFILDKSFNSMMRPLIFSVLLVAIITFNFASTAAEPKRIALLPFKINAEKDMSFLRDGIFDMLTSRLSKEGEVVVLSRKEAETALAAIAADRTVNEALAREIGTRLNADFTLFGSLTVLGDSISIDSKMVDVSGSRPTMTFSDQSQDLGGVITKINLIAAEINEKIGGRQVAVAKKTAPQPQAAKLPKDDAHAHPEKLLQGRGAEEDGSPFIMREEKQETFQKFWRSASFKHLINGIALGDVDSDGKIETVVITPHAVIIYRSENERFYKAHEINEMKGIYNIGVDVADINGNGFPEIFVTSLKATRNGLSSFVLEYNGQQFSKIVEHSGWFFRVADDPNLGKILLGQKHRRGLMFSNKIYDLVWQNSAYKQENEINTPRKTSLLGFALGDVLNDGQETAVAYQEDDYIQIIASSGEVMWKSSERYGGSTLYFADTITDRGDVLNPKYFPMRLLVGDTNGDGTTEVIAVKNYEMARRKLEKFRKFTNAHVESLSWDGLGLTLNWKTRKISGHIRDFALGDFDNDGKVELIAAVIQSEGAVVLLTQPKSTLIAYELPS